MSENTSIGLSFELKTTNYKETAEQLQNVAKNADVIIEKVSKIRGLGVTKVEMSLDNKNVINGVDQITKYLEKTVKSDNQIKVTLNDESFKGKLTDVIKQIKEASKTVEVNVTAKGDKEAVVKLKDVISQVEKVNNTKAEANVSVKGDKEVAKALSSIDVALQSTNNIANKLGLGLDSSLAAMKSSLEKSVKEIKDFGWGNISAALKINLDTENATREITNFAKKINSELQSSLKSSVSVVNVTRNSQGIMTNAGLDKIASERPAIAATRASQGINQVEWERELKGYLDVQRQIKESQAKEQAYLKESIAERVSYAVKVDQLNAKVAESHNQVAIAEKAANDAHKQLVRDTVKDSIEQQVKLDQINAKISAAHKKSIDDQIEANNRHKQSMREVAIEAALYADKLAQINAKINQAKVSPIASAMSQFAGYQPPVISSMVSTMGSTDVQNRQRVAASTQMDAEIRRQEADNLAYRQRQLMSSTNQGSGQTSVINELTNSLNKLQQTLMLVGIAMSGRQIMDYADQWTHFTNAVGIATEKTGNAAGMQERLFKLAQDNRAPLESITSIYLRMSRAAESLNMTQGQTVQMIDTVTKSLAIMGTSPNAVRGGLLQLEQALGGVTVRGQEFKSILDSMPNVMTTVAKHYLEADKLLRLQEASTRGAAKAELEKIESESVHELSISKLRNMMYQGEVTSKAFGLAINMGQEEINATFEKTHKTFAQAFTTIENGFVKWVGGLNEATKASDNFYKVAQLISNNFNIVIGVVGAATVAVAAYALSFASIAIAMNPIGAAIAVVAGLTAGFILLKDEVKFSSEGLATWGDVADEVFKDISSGFDSLGKVFEAITENIGQNIKFIQNSLKEFKEWMNVNFPEKENPAVANFKEMVTGAAYTAGSYILSGGVAGQYLSEKQTLAESSVKSKLVDQAKSQSSEVVTNPAYDRLNAMIGLPTKTTAAISLGQSESELNEARRIEQARQDKEDEITQLSSIAKKQAEINAEEIRRLNLSEKEQFILREMDKDLERQRLSIKDGTKVKYEDLESYKKHLDEAGVKYKEIFGMQYGTIFEEKESNKITKQAEADKQRWKDRAENDMKVMSDVIAAETEKLNKLDESIKPLKLKVDVDKQQFISNLEAFKPAAMKLGIDPKMLLAQSANETGWGKSVVGNNLFNIKADKSWQGESVSVKTKEEIGGKLVDTTAKFRKYNSVEESVNDFVNFILTNPRYKSAVESAKQGDSTGFIKGIAKAGYATDSNYANKVISTYEGKTLNAIPESQVELVTKRNNQEQKLNELKKAQLEFEKNIGETTFKNFQDAQRNLSLADKQVSNAKELAETQIRANKVEAEEALKLNAIRYKNVHEFDDLKKRQEVLTGAKDLASREGLGAIPQIDSMIKASESEIVAMREKMVDLAKEENDLLKQYSLTRDESALNALLGVQEKRFELETKISDKVKERTGLSNIEVETTNRVNQARQAFDDKLEKARNSGAKEFWFLTGGKNPIQQSAEDQAKKESVMTSDGKIVNEKRYTEIQKGSEEIASLDSQARHLNDVIGLLSGAFTSFTDKIIKEGKSFSDAFSEVSRDMLQQATSQMMQSGIKDLKEGKTTEGLVQMGTSAAIMVGQMLYSSNGKDNTRPATLATGTVLGAPNEVSHSIDNIGKILQDIHYKEYPELRSMGKNFKALSSSIDDFIAAVAKSTGNFNLMVDIPTPKVNIAGDQIMNAVAGAIMGAVTGALTGGLMGAIGGSLLGGLMGFAGTKATVERIGEGIILNSSTLIMDAAEQAMVTGNTFAKDKITIKGFLGTKTKFQETLGDLSSEFTSSFNKVLLATANTIWDLGKGLNLEGILGNRLTTIRTPSVKWDTLDSKKAGNTGEFMKDQINAYLDRIAESVFGNLLGRFQKLGEGMLETVGRLRVGVAVAFGGLDKLGIKIRGMFDESPMGAIEFSNAMAELWDSTGNAKDGVKNLATALNSFYDITTSQGGKLTDSYTKLTSLIATVKAKYPDAVGANVTASNITGVDLKGFLSPITEDLAKTSVQLGELTKLAEPIGLVEKPQSNAGDTSWMAGSSVNWKQWLGVKNIESATWEDIGANKATLQAHVKAATNTMWTGLGEMLDANTALKAENLAKLENAPVKTSKELASAVAPIEDVQKKQADLQAMVLASQQAYSTILENRNVILTTEVDVLKGNLTLNQQLQYAIKKDLGTYSDVNKQYSFSTYNTTEDIRNSTNFALDKSTLSVYDKMMSSLSTEAGTKKYTDILGTDAVSYLKNVTPVIKTSMENTIVGLKNDLARATDETDKTAISDTIKKFEDSLADLGKNGIPITTQSFQLFAKAMEVIRKDTDAHTLSLYNQSQLLTDGRLTTEVEKRNNAYTKEITEMSKLHGVNSQYVTDLISEQKAKEDSLYLTDLETAAYNAKYANATASEKVAMDIEKRKLDNFKKYGNETVDVGGKMVNRAVELNKLLIESLNADKLNTAKNALKDFGKSVAEWVIGLRTTQLGSTKSQLDIAAAKFDYQIAAIKNVGELKNYDTSGIKNEDVRKQLDTYISQINTANKGKSLEDIKSSLLSGITGNADQLIGAIKNFYGSSKEGSQLIEQVISAVSVLPESIDPQLQMLDVLKDIREGIYQIPDAIVDKREGLQIKNLQDLLQSLPDFKAKGSLNDSTINRVTNIANDLILSLDVTSKSSVDDALKAQVYDNADNTAKLIQTVIEEPNISITSKNNILRNLGVDIESNKLLIQSAYQSPESTEILNAVQEFNKSLSLKQNKLQIVIDEAAASDSLVKASRIIKDGLAKLPTLHKVEFIINDNNSITNLIAKMDDAIAKAAEMRAAIEAKSAADIKAIQDAARASAAVAPVTPSTPAIQPAPSVASYQQTEELVTRVQQATSFIQENPTSPNVGNALSVIDSAINASNGIVNSQEVKDLRDRIVQADAFIKSNPTSPNISNAQNVIDMATANLNRIYSAINNATFANGGAFTNGIVTEPTMFNMGLMGEAGSEAIMPLANVGGKLGVLAANDSNTNSEEELAELKKQNQLLAAQNAILQAGFQQLLSAANVQANHLDNIDSTTRKQVNQ